MHALNPAMPISQIGLSAPPAIITSASPNWISRAASPIACAPVEHAVTTAWFGPLKRWRMLTCPETRLISATGDEKRRHAARPAVAQQDGCVGNRLQAANARPDHHAGAAAGRFILRRPARITDRLFGGGNAIQDEVIDLAGFFRFHPVIGVETAIRPVAARHFAGIGGGQMAGVEPGDRPGPGLAGQQAPPGRSTPHASGVTIPKPVTTTLRMLTPLASCGPYTRSDSQISSAGKEGRPPGRRCFAGLGRVRSPRTGPHRPCQIGNLQMRNDRQRDEGQLQERLFQRHAQRFGRRAQRDQICACTAS